MQIVSPFWIIDINCTSWCLGSVVVSVMDSHSCDRDSNPDQDISHNYTLCFE